MHELHGYYLEDLDVGMTASYAKTVTEADVILFAGVSGDDNPVHINAEYAEQTMFGQRIVHGMFSAALISAVLGNLAIAAFDNTGPRTGNLSTERLSIKRKESERLERILAEMNRLIPHRETFRDMISDKIDDDCAWYQRQCSRCCKET